MTPDLSSARLLLLTLGSTQEACGPALLLPAVAARLAALTRLPLHATPESAASVATLQTLQAAAAPWIAPLPVDPGLWQSGGSWAEALGAWRQPCVLVMHASRLGTGLPAAGTALLERWDVPLVGLLQWSGPWDRQARRADGLPWLGCLDGEDQEAEAAELLEALRFRWRLLAGRGF